MRNVLVTAFTLAIAMTLMMSRSPLAACAGDKPADETMALAVKLTTEGAATFDNHSSTVMADTYLDAGAIDLVSKDDNGLKVQTYKGRAEIEKFYADLFKKPETIKSSNTVEYAKKLAPDVLVIAGTFDTNTLKLDALKIPFYQVRIKKAGKWLVSYMRIYVFSQK